MRSFMSASSSTTLTSTFHDRNASALHLSAVSDLAAWLSQNARINLASCAREVTSVSFGIDLVALTSRRRPAMGEDLDEHPVVRRDYIDARCVVHEERPRLKLHT
jgi:hypothetical protein